MFCEQSIVRNKTVRPSLLCLVIIGFFLGSFQVNLSPCGAEIQFRRCEGLSVTAPGEGEAQLYLDRQSEGKDYSF